MGLAAGAGEQLFSQRHRTGRLAHFEAIYNGDIGHAVVTLGMKLHRFWIVALLLTSIPVLRVAAAPEANSPATVVRALYRSSMDHFGFTPESVKLTKPWVTSELYARLWKKVNAPQPKEGPPDIEGDLFLDCQDTPTKLAVGNATINQTKAKVDVTLNWDSEKRQYIVLLKQVDGAWKVYDVHFGKDGNLTDLL
jgi:hypothetical protein